MIPVKDCKPGYLYVANARNFRIGVYNSDGFFTGIRYKFGYRYLDCEVHHDINGTACPTEELEQCPLSNTDEYVPTAHDKYAENKALFDWLEQKEKQYSLE